MLRSYSICDNSGHPMGYVGGTAKYWFHLIGLKGDKKTHSVLTVISRKFNYNALKKFDKHEINLS